MKRFATTAIALALAGVWISACSSSNATDSSPRHQLFQVSTIGALSRGLYSGGTTIEELATHGNFGLGTFDALDGEMVVLDGTVYQVRTDGVPRVAEPQDTTPFAAITDFAADDSFEIAGASDYADLQAQLDGLLSTENVPVAIKISARFPELTVRSVPAQERPFPPLTEVIDAQTTFTLVDVAGTMVGFRTPSFLSELNARGHHFHFLSNDLSAGGHVLDGRFATMTVEVQYLRDFDMKLPAAGRPFDSAELAPEPCPG